MKSIKEVMTGNLLIFTLGDSMRQLSMFITFPYFSLYVTALGGSMVDIGIVNALRPLASLFIYPIAGYLSDQYSRVKIIALTGYVSASLWIFFALAIDWRMLAIGNLLQGLMTFYFPSANSLMADSLPPEKRGIGYSLWILVPSAIGIISPYIGGYLLTVMGVKRAMRALYGLSIAFTFIISTMNLKFLREPLKKKKEVEKESIPHVLLNSYKDIFRVLRWLPRTLKTFAALLITSFFFNNLTASYWVLYSIDIIELSKIQWGTVLLISAIVNVILLIPAGIIVDKIGARLILTLALGFSSIPILFFPFSRGFWDVTALFILITVANSFLISSAPAFMAQSVPPRMRGRVMAALGQGWLFINIRGGGGGGPGMGALLTIPSVIGFLLGGFIYRYSPMLPYLLLGGSMVFSVVLSILFLKPAVNEESNF